MANFAPTAITAPRIGVTTLNMVKTTASLDQRDRETILPIENQKVTVDFCLAFQRKILDSTHSHTK